MKICFFWSILDLQKDFLVIAYNAFFIHIQSEQVLWVTMQTSV